MSLVTLVSGGMDSTLMALITKEEGLAQFPLYIDYGQLCKEREWRACRALLARHRLPRPAMMRLSGFGQLIPSGLTTRKLRINEDAFLPGRNLLFLVAAAAYAYSRRADAVAVGLLNDKFKIFPDQGAEFLRECQKLIHSALGQGISVVAPLIRLSKHDVIELLAARRVTGTYSCHSGRAKPCGRCVSCVEIRNARND